VRAEKIRGGLSGKLRYWVKWFAKPVSAVNTTLYKGLIREQWFQGVGIFDRVWLDIAYHSTLRRVWPYLSYVLTVRFY